MRRRVLVPVVCVVVVLLVAAAVVWRRGDDRPPFPPSLAPVRSAFDAAGCDGVAGFASEGRDHLQPGETYDRYRTVPPLSGPHAAQPLPSSPAVFTTQPAKESLVHNLEHGYVVIWYAGPAAGDVDRLVASVRGVEKVLVTPISYASLPDGAHVAITAWQQRTLCSRLDGAVVRAVTDYLRSHSRAPEPTAA